MTVIHESKRSTNLLKFIANRVMTVKELKEALANVPDDAEVYFDDGYHPIGMTTDKAEYDERNNAFVIL